MTEWTDATTKKVAAVAGGVLILIQFIEYPIYMELIGQLFSAVLSSWITAISFVAILVVLIYSYSAKEDWVTQSKDLVEDSINQTSEAPQLVPTEVENESEDNEYDSWGWADDDDDDDESGNIWEDGCW
jgi:hypothetical protein